MNLIQNVLMTNCGPDLGSARLWFARILLAGFALSVTACGGGGGGSSKLDQTLAHPTGWQPGVYKTSNTFANKCAAPRTGIDPATNAAFLDTNGSTTDENNFLRSWTNDTYLWYSEVPDLNPALYPDPLAYFDLLKTSDTTKSGKNKDNFHFTYPSADWYALSETGVTAGYGMELSWIKNDAPERNVVVAYTEVGSPAETKGVLRGAKLISVDGYDFINGSDNATVDKLNAGLFPATAGEVHTFEFQNSGSSTTYMVTLQAADVTKTPVQNVKVIDTPTGKVGYFLFNDHIKTAERGLYDAINQLSVAGITDLVLDVRYNGGGYLYIASELAYMIAGNTATANKVFEQTTFNDKHMTTDIFGGPLTPTPFYNSSSDIGGALPTLDLPHARVYIITSGDTCSASESIINSLRGINVEVIQIGSKTCGKPYGFYPQDNCGTTYFSIQFKGVNNKAFGEYSDGFVPSDIDNGMDNVKGCTLGDDFTHALGDSAERNLATALNYRATNTCALPAPPVDTRLQKTSEAIMIEDSYSNVNGSLYKEPGLTNRFIK
jgi:hypothetical protein